MNNEEIQKLQSRLDDQDQMIGRIYQSVEKTRKYFLWTMIGSLVMFILPMIGLIFVIPKFIGTMTGQMSQMNSLGL